MNGEQQYVLLVQQKSAKMLWYLTPGCMLLRKPSLFSGQKFRKSLENKISEAVMPITEKQKILQTQQQKTHLCAPIMLFHIFWLRWCIKQLSLPFSPLENVMLHGQNNCRMSIYGTYHRICLQPWDLNQSKCIVKDCWKVSETHKLCIAGFYHNHAHLLWVTQLFPVALNYVGIFV